MSSRFAAWLVTAAASAAGLVLVSGWRSCFGTLLVAHFALFAWGVASPACQLFGRVHVGRRGERKRLALTFDDGPEPALTGAVLDLLGRAGCRATFFVIGARALAHPELVLRAFREGHTIASHDLTHAATSNFRLTRRTERDLRETQEIVERIIGKRPLLHRPPMGLTNPHLFRALRRLGMQCVGWSARLGDAGNRRAHRLAAMSRLGRPGAVVLLHDCLPRPELRELFLRELAALLAELKKNELEAVTVDELLELAPYGGSVPQTRTPLR